MKDTKFDVYITKILKEVHPDTSMTGEALVELNLIALYVINRLMTEGVNPLVRHTDLNTTSSRDIQNAVRLILPGELSKHAISEATKAVTRYNSSVGAKSPQKKKAPAVSRSFRSGLKLSVARVENNMRSLSTTNRMSAGAPVYMAGVVEYILSEILELAGNASKDNKRQRIKPRHVTFAIRGDEEFDTFFNGAILGGGVIPHIHATLLPKSKK